MGPFLLQWGDVYSQSVEYQITRPSACPAYALKPVHFIHLIELFTKKWTTWLLRGAIPAASILGVASYNNNITTIIYIKKILTGLITYRIQAIRWSQLWRSRRRVRPPIAAAGYIWSRGPPRPARRPPCTTAIVPDLVRSGTIAAHTKGPLELWHFFRRYG